MVFVFPSGALFSPGYAVHSRIPHKYGDYIVETFVSVLCKFTVRNVVSFVG